MKFIKLTLLALAVVNINALRLRDEDLTDEDTPKKAIQTGSADKPLEKTKEEII